MKVIMITKEGYRQKVFIAVSLIILIASCSPSQINQHTKNSSEFLANDVATCSQKATALIDRELRLDSSYDRTGSNSLEVSFARFDAHKQRRRYFKNCLSERDGQKVKDQKK